MNKLFLDANADKIYVVLVSDCVRTASLWIAVSSLDKLKIMQLKQQEVRFLTCSSCPTGKECTATILMQQHCLQSLAEVGVGTQQDDQGAAHAWAAFGIMCCCCKQVSRRATSDSSAHAYHLLIHAVSAHSAARMSEVFNVLKARVMFWGTCHSRLTPRHAFIPLPTLRQHNPQCVVSAAAAHHPTCMMVM